MQAGDNAPADKVMSRLGRYDLMQLLRGDWEVGMTYAARTGYSMRIV